MVESSALKDTPAAVADYSFAPLLFHCVTPLHIGCGQDVGIVDLPVIRERVTGFPFVPGSGIRGRMRAVVREKAKGDVEWLFGKEDAGKENAGSAGCVSVLDARLLLFPVRSSSKIFHWITCREVLTRFASDSEFFLGEAPTGLAIPQAQPGDDDCAPLGNAEGILGLEEFEFAIHRTEWTFPAPPDLPRERIVLVSDATFRYFSAHATVVTQHNRLTSAKTVADGMLFSVEAVPPETVFYGFVGATRDRSPATKTENDPPNRDGVAALAALRRTLTGTESGTQAHVFLGGDEGTGLGLTRILWGA